MKSLHVVAAIIIFNEKILCAQKGLHKHNYLSYKYEFPGGKIELQEDSHTAIIREIKEELNLSLKNIESCLTVTHAYPDFQIILEAFICHVDNISHLTMTEHIKIQWLKLDELDKLDWAAADIPIVKHLLKRLSNAKS